MHEAEKDLIEAKQNGFSSAKIVNPYKSVNGYYVEVKGKFMFVSDRMAKPLVDAVHRIGNVLILIPQARLTTSLVGIVIKYRAVGAIYTAEVVNDVVNSSMPPITPHGAAFNIIDKMKEDINK